LGKHERKLVQEAEEILNDLLNRAQPSSEQKKHRLFKCVECLETAIRDDFPEIRLSTHVGNIYGTSMGNIQLELADRRTVYLELKFLKGGVGTRANIGQDSLTQFHLLEDGEACSWSQFRKNKGHKKWVEAALTEFGEYPPDLEGVVERATYLKEVVGHDGGSMEGMADQVLADTSSAGKKVAAAKVVKRIMERDREEKLEYIRYLMTLKQNSENVQKFTLLILSGAHTHEALKALWDTPLKEILERLRQGYRVYYVYRDSLTVTREDLTSKLVGLLGGRLFITSREGQTNVLISFRDQADTERSILRVVFHWKNVFQGIKTPCLNVFDEAYLKSSAC
jgi:hypothetical protein